MLTANYHGGFVELYHYDKEDGAFTFVDKKSTLDLASMQTKLLHMFTTLISHQTNNGLLFATSESILYLRINVQKKV